MKASSCNAIGDGPQSSIDGNGNGNKRSHEDMMIQDLSSNISVSQQQNPTLSLQCTISDNTACFKTSGKGRSTGYCVLMHCPFWQQIDLDLFDFKYTKPQCLQGELSSHS
jgi:hypothetical protein